MELLNVYNFKIAIRVQLLLLKNEY